MTLDERIAEYVKLQNQVEEMKSKLDQEKVTLIDEMEKEGKTKVETEVGKATLIYKQNIKYSDELSIIAFCEKNGYNDFVTKKVNTTALNKELKKGGLLTEGVKGYYSESETKVLKVESK